MFQTADMLKIFQQYRGHAIVVPGRGGRHWVNISTRPERDVPLGDPAMGGHASIAYDIIARGAGYPHTFAFENLEDFSNNIEVILNLPGPVFVAMKVVPEIENDPIGRRRRWQTRSREQAIKDLQEELGITA